MKNKINVNRLIAFVMAVVMILSLVVIDNHFGARATGNESKTVSIKELLPERSSVQPDAAGNIAVKDVEAAIYAANDGDSISFKDNGFFLKSFSGNTVSEKIATPSDAAGGLVKAADFMALDMAKRDSHNVAVYTLENDEYVFYGVIRVVCDIDEPSLEAVELLNGASGKTVIYKTEEDFYLVKKGEAASFEIKATDGADASASGIDRVVYRVGNSSNETEVEKVNGKYIADFTSSGKYTFITYDKAGNPSAEKAVIVKVASGIQIDEITTTARPTNVKPNTQFIAGNHLFDITVKAHEDADGYDVACKLRYSYTLKNGSELTGDVDFANGKATITVPADLMTVSGSGENKLVMQVEDEFGNTSYAFDANGYIVFIDDSAPIVSIAKIKLSNGKEYTLAEYNALPLAEKWTKSVSVDLSATEDNSYIESVSYTYTGEEGVVTEKIDDNSDIGAYSFTKNGMVFGDGGIKIPDCEAGTPNEITFVAVNYAGQNSTPVKLDVYIDNTPPVITLKSKFQNKEITDETQYIVTDEAGETIVVAAEDAISGLDSVRDVKVNIKEQSDAHEEMDGLGVGEYSINESGYYSFTVKARDNAGNEITKTAKFVIDNSELESSLKAVVTKDGTDTIINSGSEIVYTGGDKIVVKYTATGFNLDKDTDLFVKAMKDDDDSLVPTPDITEETDAEKPYMKTITVTYTIEKNITNQGLYKFTFNTKKNTEAEFEQKNEKQLQIAYDIEAPSITKITFKEYEAFVNNTYYYKNNPVINVQAEDNFNTARYEICDTAGNVISSGKLESKGSVNEDVTISGVDKNKKYNIVFYLSDKADNKGSANVSSSFVIDTGRPQVEISDVDGNDNLKTYWNKESVTLNVTGKDKFVVTSFKAVATCNGDKLSDQTKTVSSPSETAATTFRYSREGVYEVKVYAYDACGNASLADKCKFVIDKTMPEIAIDGIPDNRLSQGTSVEFTVSDEYGIKAENVSIIKHYTTYDGVTNQRAVKVSQEDAYTVYAATSCDEVDGKAAKYWFTYTLKDNAENENKEKTSTFYVDSTSPEVTITPVPADTNSGYYNKAVKFDVEVEEQFELSHKISITDKNGNVPDIKDSFRATAYSYSVKNSKQGIYNLNIVVTDAFGNATTKRVRYVIDKEKPVISIHDVNKTNNGNVNLGIDISDTYKGNTYSVHVVRKNASGAVAYEGNIKKGTWTGTEISPNVTFSEEGDYTVTVTAKDKAGNIADEKETSFRIDKTAPVLSITGVNDTQNNGVTATMSVEEAFSFAYENQTSNSATINVTITKKTDGSGESSVTTLSAGDFSAGNPHTASYTFNDDGEYTITMDATDASGNAAAQITKTFKVDSTAPVLTVRAVDKNNNSIESYASVGSDDSETPNYVDVSVSVEEVFFSTNDVKFTVLKDGKDASSQYFTNYSNRAETSTGNQRFDEDGVYNINIKAKDELGNEAEEYGIVFTVDNTAPSIEASSKLTTLLAKETAGEDGGILLNASDFADIADKGYEALWTVNDTSVFTVDVKMDGIDFVDFSDLTDGHHKMTITVTDEVGHVSTDEFEFTYDGTAPRIIIQGVEDGDTVNEPFTLSISLEDSEDVITQIAINGKVIDSSEYEGTMTYQMNVEEYKDYEIRVDAKDLAGNVASTYDSETNEIFSFSLKEKLSPILLIIIVIAIILLLALLIFIIVRSRKKKK